MAKQQKTESKTPAPAPAPAPVPWDSFMEREITVGDFLDHLRRGVESRKVPLTARVSRIHVTTPGRLEFRYSPQSNTVVIES